MIYDIWVAHGRQRINSVLTYSSDKKLKLGAVVKVPFRSSYGLGIVVRKSTKKIPKTKPVSEIMDVEIPPETLSVMKWIKAYYPSPVSSIASLFTPSINSLRYEPVKLKDTTEQPLPPLTKDQKLAVAKINKTESNHIYLHGVTASGKTRIYLELIEASVSSGKSSIVLTPEIGLTTPLVETVRSHFGKRYKVINYHSQLTQKQRDVLWLTAATSDEPLIIIGPRSALFIPVRPLGLVVVDEAHDSSYKQEQTPYYSATRVAAKLATDHSAKVIFGSATPSVVDFYAFREKGLPIVELKTTAIKNKFSREEQVVDIGDKSNFVRSKLLSEPLLRAIEEALSSKKQSLLFLNRRGSARTVLCQACSWRLTCPHCDNGLTYHSDQNKTICHSCSFSKAAPGHCAECGSMDILFQTPGTKALEIEINKLFPKAKTARFDRDSQAGNKLHEQHQQIRSGEVDILIGTQMLAKGLDIPKLEVVGLVQADVSMALPDFSSSEKTYQLISQVSGRLNRGHGKGKLFLQTYSPENPIIDWALKQNYEAFYDYELKQRLNHGFPPAFYMLKVTARRKTQKGAETALKNLHKKLKEEFKHLNISSPTPCFIERQSGKYCWQTVVKSKNRQQLTDIIKHVPATISANIDITDLL